MFDSEIRHYVVFCVKPDAPCETECLRDVMRNVDKMIGDEMMSIQPQFGWPEELDEARGRIICEVPFGDRLCYRIRSLRDKIRIYAGCDASAALMLVPAEFPKDKALNICDMLINETRSKFGNGAFALSVPTCDGKRETFCHKFEAENLGNGSDKALPFEVFENLMYIMDNTGIEHSELYDTISRISHRTEKTLQETCGNFGSIPDLYEIVSEKIKSNTPKVVNSLIGNPNERYLDDGTLISYDLAGTPRHECDQMHKICALIGKIVKDDLAAYYATEINSKEKI